MSSNADDQLFAWVLTTLEAVSNITDITSGLNSGICRDDWAQSDKPPLPRVEYNPFRFAISEDNGVYTGQFGITILCDRDRAYGTGNTPEAEYDLWTLESEVIGAIANQQPSLTGYGASKIGLSARRRPTLTPDDVVGRRLNFDIVLYPGAASVPLSGSDADLTGLSSNLTPYSWDISVYGSMHFDFTTSSDTVRIPRVTKPLGYVTIRARITGDGSVLFPAHGSTQSLTFYTDSNSSWTDDVLINRVQWIPNADQTSAPQVALIYGVISDSTSPVFDGTV